MNTIRIKSLVLAVLIVLLTYSSVSAQTYTLQDKWVKCGNGVELLDPYYYEGAMFTWTGGAKKGKANGYGVATKYNNGVFESKYEGNYKNGIREGKGTFTHADGTVRSGMFVNGQLVGYGAMDSPDGDHYDGFFLNYRMHGNGKYRFANGTTFEGYIVSDRPYTGKLTYYTGDVVYLQAGEPVEQIQETKSGYSPKIGQRLTEYFDEEWNRCQPKQAAYYRVITYAAPNKPKGVVKDYYISGELQSEQSPIYIDYDDEGKDFLEGEQIFYHKNGKVSQKRYYYNNKINGPVVSYYPDGTIESEAMFTNGVLDGDRISYHPNGKIGAVEKYENGLLHNNKYLLVTEEGTTFLVYNEKFSRNREAWEYNGQNGIIQVNDAESISMQASPERTVTGGIYTGFAPMSDNIISVITRQRNPGQGIVTMLFGFKDWDNMCAVSISGSQFQFTYRKNGVTVQSDEWKPSKAINPDVNELQVVNHGDKITLYINDEPVREIGRIYYDGSLCGVSLYNPSSQPIVLDAAQLVVHEVIDPERIPSDYMPAQKRGDSEWSGSGSGFFLNESGYIATNHHVIDKAKAIEVSFTRNGKMESHRATIVASDSQNDVAIIKIDDAAYSPLPAVPYGMTTRIKDTGSEVFTLGYPYGSTLGTEVKFTDGKISSKTGLQGDVRVYQISVPIQPGNSGGPLFDMEGNVVGLTSAGLNKDYFQSENVNYAVKASYLKTLIDSCSEKINPIGERLVQNASSRSLVDTIKQYESYMVFIKVR